MFYRGFIFLHSNSWHFYQWDVNFFLIPTASFPQLRAWGLAKHIVACCNPRRSWLSRKQLILHPWACVAKNIPIHQRGSSLFLSVDVQKQDHMKVRNLRKDWRKKTEKTIKETLNTELSPNDQRNMKKTAFPSWSSVRLFILVASETLVLLLESVTWSPYIYPDRLLVYTLMGISFHV